jgi:hypothetical protein
MMIRMYCKKKVDVYTTVIFSFFYDSMFLSLSNNTISLCDKSTRGRERKGIAIFIG